MSSFKIVDVMSVVFVILFVLSSTVLMGCNHDVTENTYYTPRVIDNGNLSGQITDKFLNYSFPVGVVPVLVHQDSVTSLVEIGKMADEAFDDVINQIPESNDFKRRGLLVYVTDYPRLIQLRMGSKYKSYADLTGITSGNDYLLLQRRSQNEDILAVLTSFLDNTCTRIHEYTSLHWYEKARINDAINAVDEILDYSGTPSENFYGRWFLQPIVSIMAFIYNIVENWFFAILGVVVFLWSLKSVFVGILKKIVPDSVLFKLIVVFINALIALFFSLTTCGAAIALSGGRLEDLIALKALGVSNLDNFIMEFADYSIGSSGWIVFFLLIVVAIKSTLFVNMEEKEAGDKIGNIYGYLPVVAVAAYFLMPKILCLVLLLIMLSSILFKISSVKFDANFLVKFLLAVVFSLIISIIMQFCDPTPDRNEVNLQYQDKAIFDQGLLEGNYVVTFRKNDNSQYGTAILKRRNDTEYALLITGQSDPVVYNMKLDLKKMIFNSNELGKGCINYDKTLDKLKISFNLNDDVIWIFSK